MDNVKDQLVAEIDKLTPELTKLNEYIYQNPELGHEEYKSSKAHVDLLQSHGFQVEYPYLNIETAFRAEFESDKPGPTVSYLAEYDALEGIGHGCGHNILGTTSTGAGIAMSKMIQETGGRVVVFGTPAEETNGDKVDFVKKGAFDDVDFAISAHPGDDHYTSGTSMAMDAIQFEFFGKSAHAAQSPFEGKNALDAVINFFNLVNAFRQQLKPLARIHGVIKEGGSAANVIPDYTRAEFYLRSQDLSYLLELRDQMITMAEAAANGTGCTMKWDYYEKSYKNLITNERLSKVYNDNMASIGIDVKVDPRGGYASMDMGDVSQVVPVINPFFGITHYQEISLHTSEFREATLTDFAYRSMKHTIFGMVKTAIDVFNQPALLKEIQAEFALVKY